MNKKEIEVVSKSGFTLIEIMLVVVIMGILAGVVMVNVKGQGDKARINATRSSISAINTAVNLYETQTSRLPTTLDDLCSGIDGMPPLLKKVQLNDAWGTPFTYSKKGEYEFEIRSAAKDMAMNTDDDITN
ncbi:MAG: type II secretion system protein GspG [Kiritimatiellae bacterium]|jgi:general secretion pathway protein G|nr:type II secretion system protein GspG [Kiritimatiellia bacterium]